MKRQGHLFEKIITFENLLLASSRAFRMKKGRIEVAKFYFHLEKELLKLQEELINETYKTGLYKTFVVYEPKKRNICAADFRDRVVHHAICHVIDSVFEKAFIYDTYACRKGKGYHRAVERTQYFASKYPYFLKCDIKKYFDSIDHSVLKKFLRKKFKDKKLLNLLDKIIDHPIPGHNPGKGLPIGNLTSQYFANFYLSCLDHFIKENKHVKGYVRYMDDFVIFGKEKAELHIILSEIREFLTEKLHLSINAGAGHCLCPTPVTEGIPFLGLRIFPSLIRIGRKKWLSFKSKVREKEHLYLSGNITEDDLHKSVSSMTAHIIHFDTLELRRKSFKDSLYLG